MKSLICRIILISFSSSILAGESICCDAELFQSRSEISHENDVSNRGVKVDFQSRYCNHSNESDGGDHGEQHHCIGCSHAPFVNLISFYFEVSTSAKDIQYCEPNEIFISPFLDGPFQPPKSNA